MMRNFRLIIFFSLLLGGSIALPGQSIEMEHHETKTISKAPPPDQMKTDVLQGNDRKFRADLDAAEAESQQEHYPEAIGHFDAVIAEAEAFIKVIAIATLPKGSIILDGSEVPITNANETSLFQGTIDRATRGKKQAETLLGVAAIQKQAEDFVAADKYREAADAYRKMKDALTANSAKIDRATLGFLETRADNGRTTSVTSYWSQKYASLRDRYNATTDGKMSPEQIRTTIQGVADEITHEGYTDPAKHPDMPADARQLFANLLTTATNYLKQ